MKFTDGYWQLRAGLTRLRPAEVESVQAGERDLTVFAPARRIERRGDTLNQPLFTVTFSSPARGVIGVRIARHLGGLPARPSYRLNTDDEHPVKVEVGATEARLTSGELSVVIALEGPWDVRFEQDGKPLTNSGERSVGLITDADGKHYVHEQLALGVGETIYGLGERFGAFVKNGQVVDSWNADGGTSSEQAYKNVPFYLSSKGYGVLVDNPAHVSFEVGSEVTSRNQFSVEGEELGYYVFAGPTPKDVLRRYTALTGRPARVPAWSMGLWLSTSFTTDYTEETTSAFVDGMAARDLPLSVFHFDCFWMRQFHWCDFVWDPIAFPDPAGMVRRLKERGLRVSLWINPYIAQRSVLFEEGRRLGYLLKRPDGSVWQWDLWQAGMAIVDFTNPDATAWFRSKLQALIDIGVDCFKTDFGERIPTDVAWYDGSDPERMHNYYAQLYNAAVFGLLEENRGAGRRGPLRALGHRRRAAVPGALGRRLRVDVRGDGGIAAWRVVAGVVGIRLLESRHRRVRGHAGSRDLQAVGGVRAALVALPAARLVVVPGAVGVRRGGGRRTAEVHQAEAVVDAVSGRGRRRGASGRGADDAADGAGVPGRSCGRLSGPSVPAGTGPARRAGDELRRRGLVLPASRAVDVAADR